MFNAGLAAVRAGDFAAAAQYFRLCIKKKGVEKGLLVKAAANLAVLIYEKKIKTSPVELQRLMNIGKQGDVAGAADVLKLTMLILTEMNSDAAGGVAT
jgi:hypothetical protein